MCSIWGYTVIVNHYGQFYANKMGHWFTAWLYYIVYTSNLKRLRFSGKYLRSGIWSPSGSCLFYTFSISFQLMIQMTSNQMDINSSTIMSSYRPSPSPRVYSFAQGDRWWLACRLPHRHITQILRCPGRSLMSMIQVGGDMISYVLLWWIIICKKLYIQV